ncbi:MAG: SpoIIE family protein phosphatase [Leptonema illini]|jgi:serine phosphatase RsbU (regulator of sigma subunit)|uniref:SpoIIE family protein phosphatase n=1 Tax=Leptonema illini TaxID=183 RepID=A0A833LX48_9LEPT|nr:MAG: SpoIIE family protein phosphatase [Leptonema illini]
MKDVLTLKQISGITTRINSELDLPILLTVIMDTARELLDTQGASLLLYDRDSEELIFDIARGERSGILARKRIPKGQGIAGECARTRKAIIVNDAQSDPRLLRTIDQASGFVTRKLIAVPMEARGELIGVLEAVNTMDGRDFTSRDVRLLTFLSAMAGLAIYNRRLYANLMDRMEELNCIHEISRSLHEHDDLEPMLDAILTAIEEVLDVERLSLALRERTSGDFKIHRTRGFSLEENDLRIDPERGVASMVLKSGEPLLVRDLVRDLGFTTENAGRYRTSSFISVPILVGDHVKGLLNAADKKNGNPFDQFELKVLTTIAAQLSSAIQRLDARSREIEIRMYRKDLETAANIQRNSLPEIPAEIAGVKMAAGYEACRDVGGDFYDFHYHSENLMSFVMADVSGKGVPAALFMEYSKTLLAAHIPRLIHPVKSLTEVNAELIRNSRMGLFVTVMLVQVERDMDRLRLASAGHNHQILYRARTGSIESLSGQGPPLGTFEGAEYREKIYHYDKGDLLVLYTDGISEAQKQNFEQYGEDRLFDLIRRLGHLEPTEIVKAIFADVNDFIEGAEQMDDATVMVVRL